MSIILVSYHVRGYLTALLGCQDPVGMLTHSRYWSVNIILILGIQYEIVKIAALVEQSELKFQ